MLLCMSKVSRFEAECAQFQAKYGKRFDAFRKKAPHQAFGSGPHHCLGAHLSRQTVGAIMLPMILERFPKMRLADPGAVVWKGFGFRGPLNLPVILG